MAVGNAIVQTAKFKPLSFKEWAAPLQALNAAHEKQEEALYNLQDEADEYARYIEQNPNSVVAQQYRDYINAIDEQAQALAENGITPQSRTDLMNLRRQYNHAIKPVRQAVQTAAELDKLNSKYATQGIVMQDYDIPYLLEHPEVNTTTVKKFIGKDVAKDFANTFKSFSEYDTTPQRMLSEDGKFTTVVTPTNYSRKEIESALAEAFPEYGFEAGDTPAPREIVNGLEALKKKYNYSTDMDSKMKDAFMYLGLNAINSVDMSPKVTDKNTPQTRVGRGSGSSSSRGSSGGSSITTKEDKEINKAVEGVRGVFEKASNQSWRTYETYKGKPSGLAYSPLAEKEGIKISYSAAKKSFPKEFNALCDKYPDFNKNPDLFDIRYFKVKNKNGEYKTEEYEKGKERYVYRLAVKVKTEDEIREIYRKKKQDTNTQSNTQTTQTTTKKKEKSSEWNFDNPEA